MQKVSLVLSGGGARGIAHIGVIEEIERRGFQIHSITGASMGALVGGVHSAGKIKELKEWGASLDKRKLIRLIDFSFNSNGMVKGDRFLESMRTFISDSNIEDLPINYSAIAADLLTGTEKLFNTGSLFDAIRASVAIPGVFTPFKTETQLLVDGGVLNNIPVNHAIREKGDILIAVDVNDYSFNKDNEALHQKMSYFTLLNRTISIMIKKMNEVNLKQYTPDILIKIPIESASMYDFHDVEKLINIGKENATIELDKRLKSDHDFLFI